MSQSLISRSPDLTKLVEDGFSIEIRDGHLLVHDVPYVTTQNTVATGVLVCPLDQAGDTTVPPSSHVMDFTGSVPCDQTGQPLAKVQHAEGRREIVPGVFVERSFSRKPLENGAARQYRDFHEKVTTYVAILASPAQAIDPTSSPLTFQQPTHADPVHVYEDTASSRAEITAISNRLAGDRVALVGLGGTNGYVLDLVAKTKVAEIHVFDGDEYLSHNAYRSPGAATLDQLRARMLKTSYFKGLYEHMHRSIVEHPYYVTAENVQELDSMDFVFIAIDDGPSRRLIVDHLDRQGIPFADLGMGVVERHGAITGHVRTTLVANSRNHHIATRIPFHEEGPEDEYASNIQVAELNAINAAFAVLRWKRLRGFYLDTEGEHNSIYVIDGNTTINDELSS